jgi:hypothetical protein
MSKIKRMNKKRLKM